MNQLIWSSVQLDVLITFRLPLGKLLSATIRMDDLYLHYRIKKGLSFVDHGSQKSISIFHPQNREQAFVEGKRMEAVLTSAYHYGNGASCT